MNEGAWDAMEAENARLAELEDQQRTLRMAQNAATTAKNEARRRFLLDAAVQLQTMAPVVGTKEVVSYRLTRSGSDEYLGDFPKMDHALAFVRYALPEIDRER